MAALEIPEGEFDPGAFRRFLAAQPDLGTKWAPRLIRVTRDLPMPGRKAAVDAEFGRHGRGHFLWF